MRNKTVVDSRQKMLQINLRQKEFYESLFEATQGGGERTVERSRHSDTGGDAVAARPATASPNLWAQMRSKVQAMRQLAGVDEQLYALHRKWMHNLKDARVLDLGCFTGNQLSLWIAENCADYTGIDLSEQASEVLNAKLRERQLSHARAYMQDFLANSYPDSHFDLVYAFSVLHHFKDMTILLEELHRVLKPNGVVISFDPLMTEPLNRLARMLYRPLQKDRNWEWPFTFTTFRLIQKYFEIADIQGFLGMVKLGFPFQMVPWLSSLGQAINRWGMTFDNKHARRPGLPLSLCWLTTLRLCKRH